MPNKPGPVTVIRPVGRHRVGMKRRLIQSSSPISVKRTATTKVYHWNKAECPIAGAQMQRSTDWLIMKGSSLRTGASNDCRSSARAEYVEDSNCFMASARVETST